MSIVHINNLKRQERAFKLIFMIEKIEFNILLLQPTAHKYGCIEIQRLYLVNYFIMRRLCEARLKSLIFNLEFNLSDI